MTNYQYQASLSTIITFSFPPQIHLDQQREMTDLFNLVARSFRIARSLLDMECSRRISVSATGFQNLDLLPLFTWRVLKVQLLLESWLVRFNCMTAVQCSETRCVWSEPSIRLSWSFILRHFHLIGWPLLVRLGS